MSTMSVLEPPLERVNYFNGERLEARDYRAEQEYFVRVRRLLNRSLYSPGIVKGLEVTKHATDTHKVIVAPGLAFDSAGREIVVFEPQTVQVVGMPSTGAGTVLGNFLVISYGEQRGTPASDACHPAGQACACRLEWSGPTRIRSNVKLEMVDTWPSEASGRIVLAQIELKQGCEVAQVHSGVRKYAVAVKPPTTRAVAIEGEKDVDVANPKRLFFHVDGGYPDTVTLVLRGALFSTLYYTELGRHTHVLNITLADHPAVGSHDHALGELVTSEDGVHSHTVTANTDDDDASENAVMIDDADATDVDLAQLNLKVHDSKPHSHKIAAGAKTDKAGAIGALPHTFTNKAANNFGALPAAKPGPALAYVDDLHVWYDGADITAEILQQLQGRDPVSWPAGSTLGDGTQNHVFVKDGTKTINLSQIVDDVSPGEHRLEFKVAAGGGQVHYNLYVE
jgi:hypothetical protein